MSQSVVIVGGTSGMGLATARRLASSGYRIILTGRDRARVDQAVSSLEGTAEGVVLDFTSQASVDAALGGLGTFDHLVLSGSGQPARGLVRDVDAKAFQTAFEQKFLGFHRCVRAASGLLSVRGSLTVLTGGAGRAAIPGTAVMAGINAGLQAWALVLAKELAPLRVNVLSPGFIDTPLHDWQTPEAKRTLFERLATGIPAGRVGRADEVAHAVAFLIENGYVSGAVLDVDGGIRLR